MDMAPYIPGASKVDGVGKIIKLSSNEGALGPSPKATAAYEELGCQLHRYPDGGSELRKAIGAVRAGPDR